MKSKKMLCVGLIPILLCSAGLALITFAIEWRDIEQKVKLSANSALSDPKFDWATVETHNRGRSALITGAPPNLQILELAEQNVAAAPGVIKANHNGQPLARPPLQYPSFIASVSPDKIILRGGLGSYDDVNTAVNSAKSAFGSAPIENNLTVIENTKPVLDFNFLSALTAGTQANNELTAELKDGALSLSGALASDAQINELITDLEHLFGDEIINDITLSADAIRRAECLKRFTSALERKKVNFQTGNAVIAESSTELLDEIGAIARYCPKAHFVVAGHTDNTGRAAFNSALSLRRAQAVVDHLVGLGLDSERFSAVGYGPERPIADNSTAEGRARNRRIEFKLSN